MEWGGQAPSGRTAHAWRSACILDRERSAGSGAGIALQLAQLTRLPLEHPALDLAQDAERVLVGLEAETVGEGKHGRIVEPDDAGRA